MRIISATLQCFSQCVEAGRFRQDLYYRLNVIELRMPALREMGSDVLVIARHVLARLATANGQTLPDFSADALLALQRYDFPGNVRELENVLERALALADGNAITAADLQLSPCESETEAGIVHDLEDKYPLQDYLDRVEKQVILEALDKTRFNRTQAAKILGLTFRSLRYRLERLGIQ